MNEFKLEKTCACIKDFEYTDEQSKKTYIFHKKREYQVDVQIVNKQIIYKLYNNGGWYDFIYLRQDVFEEYFKMII